MSGTGQIKDKVKQVVGYLKFKAGGATGNRRMQADGGADMASGKSAEVGHKATDGMRDKTSRVRSPQGKRPGGAK